MTYEVNTSEFVDVLKARLSNLTIKAKQIDNLIRCIEYTVSHDKEAYKVIGFEQSRALTEYKLTLQANIDATQDQINDMEVNEDEY